MLGQISITVGAFLALIPLLTFMRGIVEYIKQGAQKRIEMFLKMKQSFNDNKHFQEISALLNDSMENPELKRFDKKLRGDYATFFEELALLRNSGLLKKELACYMFSYDAILCWDSKVFWDGMSKDDRYWGILRKFVEEMKEGSKSLDISKGKMRF